MNRTLIAFAALGMSILLAGCDDKPDPAFEKNHTYIMQCMRDDSCIGKHVVVDGKKLRIVRGMVGQSSSDEPGTIGIGNLAFVKEYPGSIDGMKFTN